MPLQHSAGQDTAEQFVRWAATRIGLRASFTDEEGWLELPADARPLFDDRARLHFTWDASRAEDDLELLAPGSRLLHWLLARLREEGIVRFAAPADQPQTVPEITSRLYSAYKVDGGGMHLAGLALEDRRFWQHTFRSPGATTETARLFDADGCAVSDEARERLGLANLSPLARTPRITDELLLDLLAGGVRSAEEWNESPAHAAAMTANDRGSGEPPHGWTLVSTTLVWCKHASGKVRFTIGKHSTDLPFSDWARTLAPPPFVCPFTGRATRHIAMTDDGRIAAAEEIAACSETGRHLLRRELAQCAVTGRLVLPEFVTTCPVSGETLLRIALVRCSECRQPVSPHALEAERCAACRGRREITADDPRLLSLFAHHPSLTSWKKWSFSETATTYNLLATGLWQRLLVIVDRGTMSIDFAATANRISANWTEIPPAAV